MMVDALEIITLAVLIGGGLYITILLIQFALMTFAALGSPFSLKCFHHWEHKDSGLLSAVDVAYCGKCKMKRTRHLYTGGVVYLKPDDEKYY